MNLTTLLFWLAYMAVTAFILRWIYLFLSSIPCKFEQAEAESENEQHRFIDDDGTCSRADDIDPNAPVPYELTPLADNIGTAKSGRISRARLPIYQHKTRAQLQAETAN